MVLMVVPKTTQNIDTFDPAANPDEIFVRGESAMLEAAANVQPKLKIGAPNDKYEQEADQIGIPRGPQLWRRITSLSKAHTKRTKLQLTKYGANAPLAKKKPSNENPGKKKKNTILICQKQKVKISNVNAHPVKKKFNVNVPLAKRKQSDQAKSSSNVPVVLG